MSNREQLEELKTEILKNLHDHLSEKANNLVFGKGNPDADILFIGEAPGEQEDLQGIPFVGRAGKELDKLLNGIDLAIDDVYIANILKYRPPKNRDPNMEEIKGHTPYLIKQIEIIKPKVIATLGNYSTKFVLAEFEPDNMKGIAGMADLHGKPQKIFVKGNEFTVVPIYHPAAMLYRPKLRETLEDDFKVMEEIVTGKVSTRKKESQKTLF